MSLVVPAFNEEERLGVMLSEAVGYLEEEYGAGTGSEKVAREENGSAGKCVNGNAGATNGHVQQRASSQQSATGWEILVISDGSTDRTLETALKFARNLGDPASASIRVVALTANRGKGGAVTHGMQHVRGKYTVFADADGASKFADLGKLVRACQKIEDAEKRGVAIGSRAHLVGSEAVVKVCVRWNPSPITLN